MAPRINLQPATNIVCIADKVIPVSTARTHQESALENRGGGFGCMRVMFALYAIAGAISQTAASGQEAPVSERSAGATRINIRPVPPEQRRPLHYTSFKRLILIPVDVGGTRVLAVLDAGSTSSRIDAGELG